MNDESIKFICFTVAMLGLMAMTTIIFSGWPWQKKRDDENE